MPDRTVGDIPDYVYHVTYLKFLGEISENGLIPQGGGFVKGGGGYVGHARGKVFVSEADGVSFWFARVRDAAEHEYEPWEIVENGIVPVVLRIDAVMYQDYGGEWIVDPHGIQDAYANAYFTREYIAHELIEVWDGGKWVEVGTENIDSSSAFFWMENDDFEEGGFWEFRFDSDNPLLPDIVDMQ